MKTPRLLLLCSGLLLANALQASQVAVRYAEGLSRGFLVVRTPDGKRIGAGESFQFFRGERVTNHLVLKLKDGSVYEETTVFTQRRTFRLLSNRVVQKGPAFKQQMDSSIDTTTGRVVVHYSDGGKTKTLDQKVDMPDDLANGMESTIVKDILSEPVTEVSYLAITPKPRLAKVTITRGGKEKFTDGAVTYEAVHLVMKFRVTGIAGAAASVLGKQPPDTDMWVFGGEAPAYATSIGPIAAGAGVWRIDLVSPVLAEKAESEER